MNLKIDRVIDDYPYELLLLADETVEGIHKYLYDSEVYVAGYPGEENPIAVFCLYPAGQDTIEIKNIAIAEAYQSKGVGAYLIDRIVEIVKQKGCRELIVGTADCGVRQIRFYEKNGFAKYAVKTNFFLEIYDKPIYENGIMLKDMVMLKKHLV
ncbi:MULTISPECIES: GNAT family N-acetyltransferase [unclassified Parabacteroides]|uniref:GNAT family N-acetyltransferase n=1 Tax=unclassified Parabacteroides TaxID=2649774 RepID=UPI002475DB58|nr:MULTISPECIES: GNAT family N-acetyltransferase [unclassified Parabacteroides]